MKLKDLLEEMEVSEGLINNAKKVLGMKTDEDKAEEQKQKTIHELIELFSKAPTLRGSRDYSVEDIIGRWLTSNAEKLESVGIKVTPPIIGHDGAMIGGKSYDANDIIKISNQLKKLVK